MPDSNGGSKSSRRRTSHSSTEEQYRVNVINETILELTSMLVAGDLSSDQRKAIQKEIKFLEERRSHLLREQSWWKRQVLRFSRRSP
jgi:hypothetical protein